MLVAHRDVVGHRQRLALSEEIEVLVGRAVGPVIVPDPVWVLSVLVSAACSPPSSPSSDLAQRRRADARLPPDNLGLRLARRVGVVEVTSV